MGVKAFHWLAPGVLKALGWQREIVERGRRATADLFAGLIKRYSFGTPEKVDPGIARFGERLIEATPIDVVAEFFPAFAVHDKTEALVAYDAVPALVLAGESDLITPADHSRTIAEMLPDADLVCVPGAGHLVMLERPELVNDHLVSLVERAARRPAARGPPAPDPAAPACDRSGAGTGSRQAVVAGPGAGTGPSPKAIDEGRWPGDGRAVPFAA